MTRLRVWVAFVLLSFMWGSSYLWIRIGVRQLSPLALVSLRVCVGALTILGLSLLRRQDLRLPRRAFILVLILGTTNTALPFTLISWGETAVPSGLASVLNSTVPIFTVLIAAVALRDEPITVPRASGVALGFGGLILLTSGDLLHSSVKWTTVLGELAVVFASVCYAASAVFTRRTLRDVSTNAVATYVLCVAAVETTVLSALFSPPPITSLHASSIVSVLWLGFLGTGLAYGLSYYILQSWGAARYTLVAYMLPVVGLTLGAVFLGEALSWRILSGSALVILGVVLASLSRRRVPARVTESSVSQPVSQGEDPGRVVHAPAQLEPCDR